MPLLYHFSPKRGVKGIFEERRIRKGVVASEQGPLPSTAVNLTSDTRPEGHGLPDGREITPAQAKLLGACARSADGKLFSLDFTKYRLAVRIPDGHTRLVQAKARHSEHDNLFFELELRGYFPVLERSISTTEADEMRRAVAEGKLELKGPTWWYFFDEIPLSWVAEVGIRNAGGAYMAMPPAAFAELLAQLEAERAAGE